MSNSREKFVLFYSSIEELKISQKVAKYEPLYMRRPHFVISSILYLVSIILYLVSILQIYLRSKCIMREKILSTAVAIKFNF